MSARLWNEGRLTDLEVEDDDALYGLPGVPWADLRGALADLRFCWPASEAEMPSAWEDLTRQSNLLNWHPADTHELVRGVQVGADELCHLAVHKVLFRVLGAPEDWRSWLFAEAAASASDILVLGALLRTRREAAFVPMQLEVLQVCWEDAGRDEDALHAALVDLSDDPVRVWRDVVQLIEAHVTEQLELKDVRASAAAFAARLSEPWGPLLLHFQTAWWVGALRDPARRRQENPLLPAIRQRLLEAEAPLAALVEERSGGDAMTGA